VVANTYQINFDIGWENSWRTSTLESNYDAVWIVVKYREDPATAWLHADVRSSGSVLPAGTDADFINGIGLFLYRDADGIGDVDFEDVSIRWDYANDFPDDQTLEICVMAIEMVYIPQGAFEVGDDSNVPEANFQAGILTSPYTISSEGSITLGGTDPANLNVLNAAGFEADDFSSSTTQTLSSSFPKGFNDFYIMKYESSEQQYVDFLNKLPSSAASNRFPDQFGNNGHGINDDGSGTALYTTNAPNQACGYLEWEDVAAYADWIGLRPMSELEYEKAARGTRAAVADEGAWGNANGGNVAYNIVNASQANEGITNLPTNIGNASFGAQANRPLRCGIFAASAANKTRQETGGSFYGVMELSGNLFEPVVTIGDAEGRAFSGSFHGNGIITSSGTGTVATWPEDSAFSSDYGDGTGARGGGFGNTQSRAAVSNREFANFPNDTRYANFGMRLVRTAP
ncbi:MAG: SUMF1/EgtB/PvdO family nonheme iron enzyme, partial [Bacteroidota bacterium]